VGVQAVVEQARVVALVAQVIPQTLLQTKEILVVAETDQHSGKPAVAAVLVEQV
jgi:hypothetical protein